MSFPRLAAARMPLQSLADAATWVIGILLANAIRLDFHSFGLLTARTATVIAIAMVLQIGFGFACHLYRGRYRFGSFEEVLGVLVAAGSTTVVLTAVNLLWPAGGFLVPRSVPVAGGLLAFTFTVGIRYAWRLFIDRRRRPGQSDTQPLLVFGAGVGGYEVIAAMLRDVSSPYYPVGILDDDPRKQRLRLRGVPVLGTRDALAAAVASTGAETLLLAVPSADARLVREVDDLAKRAGVGLKILPAVGELIDGQIAVDDIRDLDLVDLLGRRQIELDLDSISDYITGRRVLVTGAGGSIGSELCRQLARFGPAELIMLDRDESALHAVQLSISGRALLESNDLVLADIRDIDHLRRIFDERRPHVVFHAAALKHLTLLERFPGEAVKSNVWGTLTVLEAAKAAGTECFINISTDKAAAPISALGSSKRVAERLTAAIAAETKLRYMSVRFGNVLGSRGSVLMTFAAQVAAGGPLTVTDPDVTRYFMTVQEAVQLVVQAGAIGNPGEVLVLDMGEPVRIADVAQRLAEQAKRTIEVVFTGLRPGEKRHEALFGRGEHDVRPRHPLISQIPVPPIDPVDALALDPWAESGQVNKALLALAGEIDLRLDESASARAGH